MGMSMTYSETDNLEGFLINDLEATEKAKNKFLRTAADKTKTAIIKHAPRSVYTPKNRKGEHIHIADDVESSLVADKEYGGKKARIRGSKRTGPLWHLVNDGTYRSKAAHFIDNAMSEVDSEIEAMLDEAMKDV